MPLDPVPSTPLVLMTYTGCETRYYSDYYVEKAVAGQQRIRQYYGGCPQTVQISEKHFIAAQVCDWIANQMVCAWYACFCTMMLCFHVLQGVEHEQCTHIQPFAPDVRAA